MLKRKNGKSVFRDFFLVCWFRKGETLEAYPNEVDAYLISIKLDASSTPTHLIYEVV